MKSDDQIFLERVRVKAVNLSEEKAEPVPELYTFDNVVKGEVIRRSHNELSGTHQYDVSFTLNGMPVGTSFQMSDPEVQACAGSKAGAQYALLQAFTNALVTRLSVLVWDADDLKQRKGRFDLEMIEMEKALPDYEYEG